MREEKQDEDYRMLILKDDIMQKIHFYKWFGGICVFCFSMDISAQLIVEYGVGTTTLIASQHAEDLIKFGEQIAELKQQLEQSKKQYQSMTDVRNFGKDISLKGDFENYLPENWQAIYKDIQTKGYAGLTPDAKKIYDSNKVFDACKNIKSVDEKLLCEARSVKAAQDKAFALTAFDKSQNRLDQIEKLMYKIYETKDPKSIAELQARISVEEAALKNEATKLEMFQLASKAEEQLQKTETRRN